MLDNIPNWIYMFVICYTEALKRNSTCGTTWYFRQLFSVLFIIFGNVVFPSSDEANKINKKKCFIVLCCSNVEGTERKYYYIPMLRPCI